MDVWMAIVTGVISGVISAVLLFISRALIVAHVLPWYQDLIYRGIDVDGKWYASHINMQQDFSIDIKQSAGIIRGDARLQRRADEIDKARFEDVRDFKIDGRIQDRYITLTLSHRNRQRIGVVTLLLEPVCDGRQLDGVMSFISMESNELDSIYVHFSRDAEAVVRDRLALEADLKMQRELPLSKPPRRKVRKKEAVTDEGMGEKSVEIN
jgi:hypothetical protein